VVLLYNRKYSENLNQLWDLIPADIPDNQSMQSGKESTLSGGNEDDGDDEYAFSSASYAL
jgi:hypothetical protein